MAEPHDYPIPPNLITTVHLDWRAQPVKNPPAHSLFHPIPKTKIPPCIVTRVVSIIPKYSPVSPSQPVLKKKKKKDLGPSTRSKSKRFTKKPHGTRAFPKTFILAKKKLDNIKQSFCKDKTSVIQLDNRLILPQLPLLHVSCFSVTLKKG